MARVRFLTYLVAALQRIDQDIGQAAQSLLGSPQLPPVDSLVTALINDISATLESPSTGPSTLLRTGSGQGFALVLGDYHAIHTEWVHQAVEFLITHQPPQVHLTLVTRQDPPPPLPRVRVRGQVTEIREGAFRTASLMTLLSWLDALPDELVRTNSELAIGQEERLASGKRNQPGQSIRL
jgi:LuxR family maltose regulon positive regulatory protein